MDLNTYLIIFGVMVNGWNIPSEENKKCKRKRLKDSRSWSTKLKKTGMKLTLNMVYDVV
jgi:hypothetical protein